VAAGAGGVPGSFTFSGFHPTYKVMLALSTGAGGSGRKIKVLDTGVANSLGISIAQQKNFTDSSNPTDVTDDNGHGTAVAAIIHDLAPNAEFIIYKVADRNGVATEWDTLTALAAGSYADVINISLAFGLKDRICSTCGRQSHSSRSAVFENLVSQFDKPSSSPVLVGAAGNDADPELCYPARFGALVGVESIDSAKTLSTFSNHGDMDHEGKPHGNVFVLPGGQKQGPNVTEYIGDTGPGTAEYWGTSFAAAYASALIASLWSEPAWLASDRTAIVDHLKNTADRGFNGYTSKDHGNGLMQYVP
jgi:subtilisin family serine protease